MHQGALKSILRKEGKKKLSCKDKCKLVPDHIGAFISNKYVQTLMFLITVYALIGDDIRLLTTSKDADEAFMWMNIITLGLFTIELIFSSIGAKGYLGSFFFWLDFLSTISIVTDIEPLWEAIVSIGGTSDS